MEISESFSDTLTSWIRFVMQRSMRSFLLYSKQNGFSITQVAALSLIHRKGISSVSDIGEELDITIPAASQLLERLVQQGLILRNEDPVDRRIKQVALTDKGRQVLRESIQARQGWMEELANLLTPDEQAQVAAALETLLSKAQQLEQQTELSY